MPGTEHRNVPPLRQPVARRARAATLKTTPWVEAELHPDDDDPRVFAAVYAVIWATRTRASNQWHPWLVRGVLRLGDNQEPLLTRVSVEHRDNDNIEVTGHVLHNTPVGTIRKQAVAMLERRKAARDILRDTGWDIQEDEDEPVVVGKKRGRPSYTPAHLEEVARRAVALQAAGAPRIRDRLADEFGLTKAGLGHLLARAREEHWLAPATQGRSDFREGQRLLNKGGKRSG
jgi:hypothetical protein